MFVVNLFIITFVLIATIAPIVSASEINEEEMFIEGELRERKLEELGNSISLIKQTEIELRETRHLEDLLNLAPNVNYAQGASRGRFIQIRGVGERSQFVSAINPSVGVIVDGIDFTGISTGISALDTQQIEIFRGPQGTLYGANALAGLINVVGTKPTNEWSQALELSAGNYGTYSAKGIVNIPLSQNVKNRLAIQQFNSDGFIDNTYLDRDDTNQLDEFSLRNQLAFNASKNLAMSLTTYYIDVDNGYDAFSLDNTRETLSDEPGEDTQRTLANALSIQYSFDQSVVWENTFSHANSDINYGYDEDWSYRTICPETSSCAFSQYSSTDLYERENNNFTVDSRLVSGSAFDQWKWLIGLYYRNQEQGLVRTRTDNDPNYTTFYSPVSEREQTFYKSIYDSENAAIYGQLDIPLSSSLTLITGLRVEQRSYDFYDFDPNTVQSGSTYVEPIFGARDQDINEDENFWGGKIALEYLTVDNGLIYGLISRGYKAGGVNTEIDSDNLAEFQIFDSAGLINYELGYKNSWLDHELVLQASLFFQDYTDQQVNVNRAVIPLGGGAPDFVEFIANAAESTSYGLELETYWQASEKIHLFAMLGLLNSSFSDFNNGVHVDAVEPSPSESPVYDMKDRNTAHSPSYQYHTGVTYRPIEKIALTLDVEGKDEFYFSNSHETESDAYKLLNLRAKYGDNKWSIALWGKNLTDEEVGTRGFYFSNDGGNDPRKGYAAEPYIQLGAPRTFGTTIKLAF